MIPHYMYDMFNMFFMIRNTGILYTALHWQQSKLKLLRYLAWLSAYRKTCNISRTLVGNKIVDHSHVVGASPVGAAPTTSSFST